MKIIKHTNTPRTYRSYNHFWGSSLRSRSFLTFLLFCLGLFCAFIAAKTLAPRFSDSLKRRLAETTITVVNPIADILGDDIIEDKLGNVNILLAGYGGDKHDGGKLTDTIIIASYNPNTKSVLFFSIPRDLSISYPDNGGVGKINSLFPLMFSNNGDLDEAAHILMKKAQEITGLQIEYYALVDFGGFEAAIDTMGGITIDVPVAIDDPLFPGPNHTYAPFRLAAGKQTLDGKTALKYARTRHAKNGQGGDINRAKRGQQVIKAAINKLLSANTLNPLTIGDLMGTYQEYVTTNLTIEDALGGFGEYISSLDDVTSLQMSTLVFNPYGDIRYANVQAASFLIEQNNGRYTMIPDTGKRDDYSTINSFVAFATAHPLLYSESSAGLPIYIINATDRDKNITTNGKYINYQQTIASDMHAYGFDVDLQHLSIAETPSTGSTLILNLPKNSSTGEYPTTVDTIKEFTQQMYGLSFETVIEQDYSTPLYPPYGIAIIVGNDILTTSDEVPATTSTTGSTAASQ